MRARSGFAVGDDPTARRATERLAVLVESRLDLVCSARQPHVRTGAVILARGSASAPTGHALTAGRHACRRTDTCGESTSPMRAWADETRAAAHRHGS
jgi:hypothetical protein